MDGNTKEQNQKNKKQVKAGIWPGEMPYPYGNTKEYREWEERSEAFEKYINEIHKA